MQDKSWYSSKTIWASVASLIVAIATALNFEVLSDPTVVQTLMFGILGLIGINLRFAVSNK